MNTLALVTLFAASTVAPLPSITFQDPEAADNREGRAKKIAELMEGYAKHRSFSGAVLVSEQGQVLYENAFGLANREWSVPNDLETRFSIASVTKAFTAALTLRLIDEGLLSLDDKVSELLDSYRQDTGQKINIHHLLTHGSGLPNPIGTKEFWEGNGCRMDYSQQDFVKLFCSADLLFEPGSKTRYSDANYFLLALIAEGLTELSFPQAMREYVLEPISAIDSGSIRKGVVNERLAYGYLRSGEQHRLPAPINYQDTQLGAGDMYSTIRDLYRFDQALYDGGLLSKELEGEMFRRQAASGFAGLGTGYGWSLGSLELRESKRKIAFQHAPGNNAGFSAILYRLPENRQTIALIQNTGPGYLDPRIFEVCVEIAHALHGEMPRIPATGIIGGSSRKQK